ncbi:hypothetical protein GDO81_027534 [Engystomops pustulosus]|uniref:Transmembrane inner ear n=1 Tax=Engystomops pustulosus TaxID=76066 RepID=A0AAV6YFR8_ENGPU|nr:hypothetical protein GDO81_027534 [Engystomops pustulosus]
MKENVGVDTSWAAWFTSWAGGWKALFQQIGLVLLGMFILALFLLCCCIPLYKRLAKKIANNKAKGVFPNIDKQSVCYMSMRNRNLPDLPEISVLSEQPDVPVLEHPNSSPIDDLPTIVITEYLAPSPIVEALV